MPVGLVGVCAVPTWLTMWDLNLQNRKLNWLPAVFCSWYYPNPWRYSRY